jgi:flagellar motility protein MotE (MotC chaperone)
MSMLPAWATATIAFALLIPVTAAGEEQAATPYAIEPVLAEVRAREARLERRERDLAERERTHSELEALVAAQLQEVAEQRATMQSRIEAWQKEGGERIQQLAKIYAAMTPTKAARLIDSLEANLATQILSKMKHKKSAAVIERVSKDRALTVSRQVAHPLSFDPAAEEGGGT